MTQSSPLKAVRDSFKNLVANLNTVRDKQAGGDYYLTTLTDDTLSAIYRTSWMGRKTVDIPAKDATRKWREWEAEAEDISKIEALEKQLLLPQKVMLALQLSRLYGGSAIYFSIDGDDPALPLELETVKADSLSFVTVIQKATLQSGDIDQDPLSQTYGMPMWYEINSGTGGSQKIDPSRLVLFTGAETLECETMGTADGWGDSVLRAAYEAIRNADSTAANTASLVYEAKVDVLKIPDLSNIMANPRTRALLEQRVELSAQLKGNNGMLIVDGEEEYAQKTFSFGGLPEITYQALQAVSGAADIPLTRFLGQSPAGLSSTGESDLKNYYDSVNSMQTLIVTPALHNLDETLIRSALGNRPEELDYLWSSLWQMTDEQKSTISKQTAETIKVLADSGLFIDDELAAAAANLLVEHSILPAFEFTESNLNEEDNEEGTTVTDALPRTLYVYRKVVNANEIIKWAREQGIEKMLPAEELHVTIAYSKTPMDWTQIPEDWSGDERGRIRVKPGSTRAFEEFGDGAKVLVFASSDLKWRNETITEAGASWDYDDYHSHITITYGDVPQGLELYQGPIILSPETFEEINPDAQAGIEEIEL